MVSYNKFQIVSISGVSDFPVAEDILVDFRGIRHIMFVCTDGTNVEYSFDGTNIHGRISEDQTFNFGLRNESKIWFRGTGSIDVHVWG
jgi:hypothetical protein